MNLITVLKPVVRKKTDQRLGQDTNTMMIVRANKFKEAIRVGHKQIGNIRKRWGNMSKELVTNIGFVDNGAIRVKHTGTYIRGYFGIRILQLA